MAVKVKLRLNRLQWSALSKMMHDTTVICPVEDWALETYVIADLYVTRMAFWTIMPYFNKGKINVSLTMIQAIALNSYFAATNEAYNNVIRIHIEPKLVLNKHNLKQAI